MVLNTAARLLLRIPTFEYISSAIIITFHWLPASDRLTFKMCCLVWNNVVGASPSYLQESAPVVIGGHGASTAFFNQFALEGALLLLCHTTATYLHCHRASTRNSLPLNLHLLSNDRRHTFTFKKQLESSPFPCTYFFCINRNS